MVRIQRSGQIGKRQMACRVTRHLAYLPMEHKCHRGQEQGRGDVDPVIPLVKRDAWAFQKSASFWR